MSDPHQNNLNKSSNPKVFKWRQQIWFVGVALISIFLVGASHYFEGKPTQIVHSPQVDEIEFRPLEIKSLPEPELYEPEIEEPVYRLVEGSIARNQSLSDLMSDHGIPLKTVFEMVKQTRPTYNLRRLRPGHSYSIKLNSDDQLVAFTYQAEKNRELFIERKGDEFVSRLIAPDYEIRLATLEGVIQKNLISTVLKAGGSYQVAINLEEIFAWQINFFKDLREGDSFKVLIEKKFLDQEFADFGKIRAVTFQNRGKNLSAVYFKPEGEHGGYYTSDGRPLKKQFLKSPLKYTRITSKFTHRRFHPIYKKHMAHRAVDYAAPRGTPIYAISDGEVIKVSRSSRSGKHIKLKHSNGYVSSYSHMSGYAAKMSRGKKVDQGQIIGYVGATGAATGPHLCFHLRKNGKSINPLTFQSPGGPDLQEKNQKAFHLLAQQEMQALKSVSNT
jgi:murein DD-endopeptidase MepM/ murein hydrolase activator NlpD